LNSLQTELMNLTTFNYLVWCWLAFAILIFPVLLKVKAPYGRHTSVKWGPEISNRWGWFLMEFPALAVFLVYLLLGKNRIHLIALIVALPYLVHYVNRSLIYPFQIHTAGKKMPLIIAAMAIFFNLINASLLGYYIGNLQTNYTTGWISDPRFIGGMVIFISGMVMNMKADEYLIHLRKNSRNGYQIPRGKLFRWVSCPNFLGEIIEWAGYALLCWSLPALSFLVWTICNLVPRALDHHKWYKSHFPDYPKKRKAVLPYLV
jgi:3-oxo-5-alpha-steroid 4-dehydrogenase 1